MFTQIIVVIFGLAGMLYLMYNMVSSGRIKRKGAKKLRKRLFPLFYGERSLFSSEKIDPVDGEELKA